MFYEQKIEHPRLIWILLNIFQSTAGCECCERSDKGGHAYSLCDRKVWVSSRLNLVRGRSLAACHGRTRGSNRLASACCSTGDLVGRRAWMAEGTALPYWLSCSFPREVGD